MAEYGKLYKNLWVKPRFGEMSDRAKLLLCYIFSCPHGNSAGAFVLHPEYIWADLKWNQKQLAEPLRELLDNGWNDRSESLNVIVIREWFSFNSIQNPNQLKRILADISELPRDPIYQVTIADVKDPDNSLQDRYREALVEAFGQRLPEQLDKPFRKEKPPAPVLSESESETESEAVASRAAAAALEKSVVGLYRKKLVPPCRNVLAVKGARQTHLRARLKEHDDLTWWEEYLTRIQGSDFLTGKVPPGPGYSRPKVVDFDWLLKPANVIAVLEGKYDNNKNGSRPPLADMLPPAED